MPATPDADWDYGGQRRNMEDDSMVQTLAYQAQVVWPHERELLRRRHGESLGRVLDLACGTGEWLRRVREEFTCERAVGVDLIFLEDGVGHRRFLRVLAQVFEFYDMFGERQLEERHFAGLPGVQVWIHEIPEPAGPTPDGRGQRPDALADYPEPDYEEFGRARILHVFRDRGGEKDLSIVPFDSSRFASNSR